MTGRAREISGAAVRGDGEDVARATRIRRSAWVLAGLALLVYVGFIVWSIVKVQLGG